MSKILLIEDDPFLIDIYTTKFKEAGYDMRTVESGEEAIPVAQKERPDLIILDIVLPRIDGWELLGTLKSTEHLKDIPVVILSNLGQKEEIEKGFKLGAVSYLIKAHFTPSQVVEEIKKLLAPKESETKENES